MIYSITPYSPNNLHQKSSFYTKNVSFKSLSDIEDYKINQTQNVNWYINNMLEIIKTYPNSVNFTMAEIMIVKANTIKSVQEFLNENDSGIFATRQTKNNYNNEIKNTIDSLNFLFNQAMSIIAQYSEFNPQYKINKPQKTPSGDLISEGTTLFDVALCLEDKYALLLMKNSKNFILDEHSTKSKYEAMSLGLVLHEQNYNTSPSIDLSIPEILRKYYQPISKNDPKSLSDVGGMSEAKKEIEEFIIKPWSPKYRKALEENNVKLPNGFLMYGPPGCGKTYIAKAIASQMKLNLYLLNMAEAGGTLAYETEKELNKVFTSLHEYYKRTGTPSILFMDEMDTVLASRSKMQTDWRKGETNVILQLINNAADKGIILLGATNLLDDIDEAALRTGRFDKKIKISKPDEEARRDIFKKLASKSPIARNAMKYIDKCVSMTEDATCSDIDAMFQTAMRTAIFDGRKQLTFEDLQNAYNKIRFEAEQENKPIGFSQ